jgi:glutathione S-transferase
VDLDRIDFLKRRSMKLYLNKTSPYARLVLATAHEAGVASRLETVWLEPWDDNPQLLEVNPLSKVPALITDSGVTLIESALICDHLVTSSGCDRLLPANGAQRESVLERLGIGRAVIDCAFGSVIQRRFNDGADTALSKRWLKAIPRAVAVLEKIAAKRALPSEPDLADVATTVALDYVDFRLPEIAWRKNAPALARAVDLMLARSSMTATDPR